MVLGPSETQLQALDTTLREIMMHCGQESQPSRKEHTPNGEIFREIEGERGTFTERRGPTCLRNGFWATRAWEKKFTPSTLDVPQEYV